jgi:hypothetical protein
VGAAVSVMICLFGIIVISILTAFWLIRAELRSEMRDAIEHPNTR